MVESSVVNINLKVLLSKFDYIGAVLTPVVFLIFSLCYNKLDKFAKVKNIFILLVIPVITLILVFTNEYHGLIWSSYYTSDFRVGLVYPIIYKYGLWFWLFHVPYSYFLLLFGSFLFFKSFLKLKKPRNYQVWVILLGVLIPLIANIIYIAGFSYFPGLDITRVAFSLTGMLFVVSIFRWQFLNIVPVARSLLVEKMSDGIIVVDDNNSILDINPSAIRLCFLDNSQEFFGCKIDDVLEGCNDFKKALLLSKDFKINFKSNIRIKSLEIELSVEHLFDKNNNSYGRLLVLRDISELKRIENNLIKEKDMAQKYLDIAKIILLALDKNGKIILINKKGLEVIGYKKEELISKNWFKLCLPKEIQEKVLSFFKKLSSGQIKNLNESYENEILTKKGERRMVAWYSSLIKNKRGEIIGTLSSGEDITDKKRDEEIIESNNKKLSKLLRHLKLATESAKIGIWNLNLKNNFLIWDKQMYELYGVKKANFNRTYNDWRKCCYPEDLPEVEKEIARAVKKKDNLNTSFRIVWPDGSIRYIKAFGNVLRDKKNEPIKIVGVNIDITDEKEIDKAKSEFVSLASHQLRTPLTAVNWYTEMLLMGDGGKISEEQKSYLEEIHSSNRHMVDLVNSLLNVSRIELGSLMIDPDNIDLVVLTNEIIKRHRIIIDSKKIKFSSKFSKKLPNKFLADKKLLGIIFQNVLSNAINYTPDKGSIFLSIDVDDKIKNIVFKVSDTGYGIPKGQQDKIFDKLFRADNARKIDTNGTGLGLYIIKSIVDKSGGKIWFESSEGKGSTFYVSLPIKGMKRIRGSKSLI
jgi:PAS domain S-box-containing protein